MADNLTLHWQDKPPERHDLPVGGRAGGTYYWVRGRPFTLPVMARVFICPRLEADRSVSMVLRFEFFADGLHRAFFELDDPLLQNLQWAGPVEDAPE